MKAIAFTVGLAWIAAGTALAQTSGPTPSVAPAPAPTAPAPPPVAPAVVPPAIAPANPPPAAPSLPAAAPPPRPVSPAPLAPRPLASAPSAPRPPAIGFIDSSMFGNENGGIVSYVRAIRQLDAEFKPRAEELRMMQLRLDALTDAAKATSSGAATGEYQVLKSQIDARTTEAQAALDRRQEEVVAPVGARVAAALGPFARARGLVAVFDVAKMGSGVIFVDGAADVNAAFIADYNARNP